MLGGRQGEVGRRQEGQLVADLTAALGGGRWPSQSARTVVRLATLGADGPTGTFSDEAGELRW